MNNLHEKIKEGEQKLKELKNFILEAFADRFGKTVIDVNMVPLITECWVYILVKRSSPEIEAFAAALEQDFQEEMMMEVTLEVKVPFKYKIINAIRGVG